METKKVKSEDYGLEYDTGFITQRMMFFLRLNSGLTQKELAKRAKVLQPSLSRAEISGCSLAFLNKIAKATKQKIEFKITPNL